MKENKATRNFLIALAILVLPVAAITLYNVFQASAAVVVLSPVNNALPVGGGEITFSYTASSAIEPVGSTYEVIVSPALPGALADCGTATTAIDTTAGGAGSFGSFTSTGAIFTTTSETTTTGREFCLTFPAETEPNSYSVFVSTSTGDFGLSMVHYDENNVVQVSATVGSSLSFNIRDLADTADTNLCQLGNVTTLTAVNLDAVDDGIGECGYSLAVGTNATNGFTVQVEGSANGLTNGTNTMDDVGGDASAGFDTGTEEYGIAGLGLPTGVTAAAGFTATSTSTDGSPIPTTATDFVSAAAPFTYAEGTDDTDVTKVIHGLTVGSATEVGSYTQTITYTVAANF